MEEELEKLVSGRTRLATEVSPAGAVPTLDYLPAGIASVLLGMGLELSSSGDLVSRFHSAWTEVQLDEHRRAAEIVADFSLAKKSLPGIEATWVLESADQVPIECGLALA